MFYGPPGCRCDLCPLGARSGGGPVFGAGPPDAPFVLVGEAPGEREVEQGGPFVSTAPSGRMLGTFLRAAGVARPTIRITNAWLCRPPDGLSASDYLAGLPKGMPGPTICCRERLLREVWPARVVVAMGATALSALTTAEGIYKWRGSPLRVPRLRPTGLERPELTQLPVSGAAAEDGLNVARPDEMWIVPTIHPAATMRDEKAKALVGVIQGDVIKAVRIAREGRTQWTETAINAWPLAIEVLLALQRAQAAGRVVAVDTETDGKHPLDCALQLVGFAWGDEACVAPLRTTRNELWPAYTDGERSLVWCALRDFLANPAISKLFHNAAFDVPTLKAAGLEVRGEIHDTLLMHHCAYSELPHRLGFLGSTFTDSRFWKDDVRDGGAFAKDVDQRRFNLYNCRDALVTIRSARKLQDDAYFRQQTHVYAHARQLLPLAVGMHERGMLVDLREMASVREQLYVQEQRCVAEMRELLSRTDYATRNCGSVEEFQPAGRDSIRSALLAMGVPATERTATGLLKADQQTLAILAPQCSIEARKFIRLLTRNSKGDEVDPATLGWRPASKLRTTYVEKPPILVDGRIHPSWKLTGTVSGRFSTAEPNVQNWPAWVRKVIIAPEGYALCAADYSQVEMRIQGDLSGDSALLDSFRHGDSHTARAALLFNVAYDAVTKHQRLLVKRYIYQLSYGGTDQSIYEKLLAEYPELQLSAVESLGKKIRRAYPRWMAWREQCLKEARRNKYSQSAVLGRRRFFLGGLKSTEVLNFPIQSTAADIINLAMIEMARHVQRDWLGVFLINQCHDSLAYEVPEDRAEAFKSRLVEVMEHPVMLQGCGPRVYPVAAKIGRSWVEV